jgi:hypothetical protein
MKDVIENKHLRQFVGVMRTARFVDEMSSHPIKMQLFQSIFGWAAVDISFYSPAMAPVLHRLERTNVICQTENPKKIFPSHWKDYLDSVERH